MAAIFVSSQSQTSGNQCSNLVVVVQQDPQKHENDRWNFVVILVQAEIYATEFTEPPSWIADFRLLCPCILTSV